MTVTPWLQALLQPRWWRIGRMRVPPLTVWAAFVLSEWRNPYWVGGDCRRADAIALLAIAGLHWHDCRRVFLSDWLRRAWVARVTARVRHLEDVELHQACSRYVAESARCARRWRRSDGATRPYAVSSELHLVYTLCRYYHMTTARAWSTSYSVARALYDAHAEAEGDTSLVHPDYEELDDALASQQP